MIQAFSLRAFASADCLHYIHYLSHCKQSAYAKAFRGAYSRFCTGGGGGEIQNLYLHRAERVITTREAWFRFPKFFLGGVRPIRASFAPPPINIIRINTLGKTHIKKVVGPLVWTTKKKKEIFFYGLEENDRTSWKFAC